MIGRLALGLGVAKVESGADVRAAIGLDGRNSFVDLRLATPNVAEGHKQLCIRRESNKRKVVLRVEPIHERIGSFFCAPDRGARHRPAAVEHQVDHEVRAGRRHVRTLKRETKVHRAAIRWKGCALGLKRNREGAVFGWLEWWGVSGRKVADQVFVRNWD